MLLNPPSKIIINLPAITSCGICSNYWYQFGILGCSKPYQTQKYITWISIWLSCKVSVNDIERTYVSFYLSAKVFVFYSNSTLSLWLHSLRYEVTRMLLNGGNCVCMIRDFLFLPFNSNSTCEHHKWIWEMVQYNIFRYASRVLDWKGDWRECDFAVRLIKCISPNW